MNAKNEQPLEFWAHADRTRDDPTNNDIWAESPFAMAQVHDIRGDGVEFSGEFGCQQAMVGDEAFTDGGHRLIGAYDDDEPLPWIPDWVGRRASGDCGVTVIGPSYPPVIKERGRLWAGIPLADYRAAETADAFLDLLTDQVLEDGEFMGHFTQLESLLFPFRTAADLCYFNLCRGSFVIQSQDPGDSDDRYDDDLDNSQLANPADRRKHQLLYGEYVQMKERWTLKRLSESRSGVVIALGRVAEHGLLRLFRRKGAVIHRHDDGVEWNPPALEDDAVWPSLAADPTRPIGSWTDRSGRWWDVRGADDRRWRVLPVFGLQQVEKEDSGYRRTRRVLNAFLNGE